MDRTRSVSHALAGLLLTALAGCGPLTIQSSPDTFSAPADAAARLRGPQTVALSNAYQTETLQTIMTNF